MGRKKKQQEVLPVPPDSGAAEGYNLSEAQRRIAGIHAELDRLEAAQHGLLEAKQKATAAYWECLASMTALRASLAEAERMMAEHRDTSYA